jgi:hypothetical protein
MHSWTYCREYRLHLRLSISKRRCSPAAALLLRLLQAEARLLLTRQHRLQRHLQIAALLSLALLRDVRR